MEAQQSNGTLHFIDGAVPRKIRTSLRLKSLGFSVQENKYTAPYPTPQKLHTSQGLEFLFVLFVF